MSIGWRVWLWTAATGALLSVGGMLSRDMAAVPATTWMHQHRLEEFRSVDDIVRYLRELRLPIPPAVSAVEILTFQRSGSADLVTKHLYRVALIGSYVVAAWLTFPSWPRLAASLCAGLVFLGATRAIHPLNPQVYDVLFPFFVLVFVAAWRLARALPRAWRLRRILLAVVAGFSLSMAELSRPFALVLVPFALVGAFCSFRGARRGPFIAMLVPVLVFTGGWHAHLWVAHRQLLSTNYAGFNLRRAWPQVSLGPSVTETHTHPADETEWPNLNTEETSAASQRVVRTTLAYVLAQPREALSHAIGRVAGFVAAPTTMYGSAPADTAVMPLYRAIAPAGFVLLLANVMVVVGYAVCARSRCYLVLAEPDDLLLVIAVCSLLALSLGEAGEEARLVLTLLPFLAAVPLARPVPAPHAAASSAVAAGSAAI